MQKNNREQSVRCHATSKSYCCCCEWTRRSAILKWCNVGDYQKHIDSRSSVPLVHFAAVVSSTCETVWRTKLQKSWTVQHFQFCGWTQERISFMTTTAMFKSISMLLSKQIGYPIFVQSHPQVKNCKVNSKTNWYKISPPIGRAKRSDLHKSWGIVPQDRMGVQIQGHVL